MKSTLDLIKYNNDQKFDLYKFLYLTETDLKY